MSQHSSNPRPSAQPSLPSSDQDKPHGRPLTVAELTVVLEELDRVVGELEDSLLELALPFDDDSRFAAQDVIAAARRFH